MNKLLCERPRGGWRLKTKRKPKYGHDWDSAPTRGRMPGRERRTKWLNENLQPLHRYLLSCVSQPWDEVYADLRANLRVSRAIDLHILQHLDHMVATDVRFVDGMVEERIYGRWYALSGRRFSQLYVCPETRRLCRCLPTRRPRGDGSGGTE